MAYFFKTLAILFFVSTTLKAGGPPKEEILDLLPQLGYGKVKREDIRELGEAGSNTESVCCILVKQENGKAKGLICKELKGQKNEYENLKALEPFVDEYEKFRASQPSQFPPQDVAIARYRGALNVKNREFVLFDEASGQSVFDLMTEWAQRGYDWDDQLNPLETKHRLSCAFSNVGYATASFHLKHGSLDEETDTFNSITHGDLHTSNMFYNLLSNQTTFIDYETMITSKENKRNIYGDMTRLFDFSKKETEIRVQEKAGAEFCRLHKTYTIDEKTCEQQVAYIGERLAILDDFFKALKKGYIRAFMDAGYICKIETDGYKVKRVSLN